MNLRINVYAIIRTYIYIPISITPILLAVILLDRFVHILL